MQALPVRDIALYKDRQPLTNLRKRNFTAAVQEKYNTYPFLSEGDLRAEE